MDCISERAKQAQKIASQPELYKICEGCESIVAEHVATCPSCHGYRFNPDPAAVAAHATLLGSREQTSVTAGDLL